MQDSLYPLGVKDVEAIGRSRANRSLPQNVKYWLYGGFAVAVIGFFYSFAAKGGWVGIGVIALGAVGIWYSSVLSDRVRKVVISQLMADLRVEREKERKP